MGDINSTEHCLAHRWCQVMVTYSGNKSQTSERLWCSQLRASLLPAFSSQGFGCCGPLPCTWLGCARYSPHLSTPQSAQHVAQATCPDVAARSGGWPQSGSSWPWDHIPR